MRLSNDDGDKAESDSISSQRSLIENYINKNEDMLLWKEYCDDGYTGTNFKRPGIQELLKDAQAGLINCVVVKDLSRFGRNYIEVGNYLEQYFPMHSIRFVAINDNYDSLYATPNDEFIMPIRNVFNAHYSKDISKKVKSSFRIKQSEGEFVGAFAGYGYKKDPRDRHKLIIDEEAAMIVRRIFRMYIEGQGKIGITHRLNEEKIPCPSEYKRLKGLAYHNAKRLDSTKYWTYATVSRILCNEMYIGNMVQNRTERKTVRGKATKMQEEKWIVIKGTHEEIIDQETWRLAQELQKRRNRQPDFNSNVGLFSGFIKCGDCGRNFSKVERKGTVYYVCGTYKRYSSKLCSSHGVQEELLVQKILEKLNEEMSKVDEQDFKKPKTAKSKVDTDSYQVKLDRLYGLKKECYEDYKSGLLTKEEYLLYREDYTKEEELIKGQMEAVMSMEQENSERNEWIENLKKYKRLAYLDRAVLACVLDGITVYETEDEKRIDIKLKYVL